MRDASTVAANRERRVMIGEKALKLSIAFALAFLVMVAGSYPTYHALQFDPDVHNCMLAALAHHQFTLAVVCALGALTTGAMTFVFMDGWMIDRRLPGRWGTLGLLFAAALSVGFNFWAVQMLVQFWGDSAQPRLVEMHVAPDGFICPFPARS